ncbi:hypothetical protein CP980_16005 [Streptomyces vinaceus]|uniref:Uncharacterized protein n=1 Tax=Streptomyces vinaceus TaxID=1960 RepID=A0A5J6J8D2_STRVI|nr:hypothetical protein [Streptomyces vinaceus]QEV46403.1 hypothetical protein CP980_16005 [Streptomyces vinaceus]GHE66383.1 hypothetical protein GCM10017778_59230 [Streptomyces vinaceus]
MSGDSYYFGRTVNMHGGTHNTGMVNHGPDPASVRPADPALAEAVRELVVLLAELREQVSPLTARSLDDALPALAADSDAVPPEERHRALMAVAGIAATAGALGQPVLDAVRAVLELLAA